MFPCDSIGLTAVSISGSSSAVERQLPKLDVAGSIPVSRSRIPNNSVQDNHRSRTVAGEVHPLEVGYESEPAFNRAFKREFKLPPARFRAETKSAGKKLH